MPFNIGSADEVAAREDEGLVIELVDQAGRELPGVTMTVAGTYSTRYRKAQAAVRNKWAKRRGQELSGEEIDRQTLATTAGCVIAWSGFVDTDAPVPCTPSNVEAVLDRCPWFRNQVDEAMQNHAAFFATASARS